MAKNSVAGAEGKFTILQLIELSQKGKTSPPESNDSNNNNNGDNNEEHHDFSQEEMERIIHHLIIKRYKKYLFLINMFIINL